jgi:VCBS repeat-containing protein
MRPLFRSTAVTASRIRIKRSAASARFFRALVVASGAVLALLLASSAGAANAPPVDFANDAILVIAPHPDDDILYASGIAAMAENVVIAYMTNGDWCADFSADPFNEKPGYCGVEGEEPEIGTARQAEAVAAQMMIRSANEDSLIFLGYPDGDLSNIWTGGVSPTLQYTARTETYASRGLGRTDWHNYRTGDHAEYTRTNLLADVKALISWVDPDHIFTTDDHDRHQDHNTTWDVVTVALAELAEETKDDASPLRVTLHTTIVHIGANECWGKWPDPANPVTPVEPDCPGPPPTFTWSQTCNCPLVWADRESFEVPLSMRNPALEDNPKYRAIKYGHATQWELDDNLLGRFVHRDEIFWAEVYAWGPTGIDDAFVVDEGGTLVVGASGVLANDVDGLVGGTPTAVKVSDPVHGSVTVNPDGSFTYVHDGSESVSDSFTYRPVQSGVQGSVAVVSITVDSVNDAPVAVDDGPFAVGVAGGSFVLPVPGVLGNDSDPEGDALTAVKVSDPSHGTVSLNANGSFTYTHDGSGSTSDSFTYRAKDGSGALSNVATVSLTIGVPPVVPSVVHSTGLVDPSQGLWRLFDDAGGLALPPFFFGNPGDYPIFGDWDGDGVETPGMYRQSDGFVYLRNSNTQGAGEIRFFFGNPGDVPIAGDFNGDGFDTVSIYRPSIQTFFIINELGANEGGLGAAEFSYVFGDPGDKPFVGDFDGDGVETVGLHRESTGLVYFRNSHSQGNADAQFIFGDPGDRLIAGDWNGDGAYSPALFRPVNTTMFFRYTNTQGNADLQFVPVPAGSTWLPIAGLVR